ncbi:mechanosensitive ion channel family protein [Marinibactrum halimedae]
MIETFIITLMTFSLALVVKIALKRVLQKAESTKVIWDDVLILAIKQPLNIGILLVGLTLATEPYSRVSDSVFLDAAPLIRELGVVLLLSWFLVRLVKQVEFRLVYEARGDQRVDKTSAMAIGRLLRISVIVSSALIVLQSLGYSVSGVLAFGGIGGIAVGFAAKDLLANFFGGLMIYLDRPFKVGDWIRSPDKEIEGVVEDIGWRQTRIRTFEKRPLYVPNATFTQISVENPSRMTNRRIYETIGVRYDDASVVGEVITSVHSMLESHQDIDHNEVIIVNFNEFAESSLNFFVYAYTKTTDWVTYHKVKQDVLLSVLNIIAAHGAQCAFPTRSVHLESAPILERQTEKLNRSE